MNFSEFGHKFGRPSGIGLLMDDLTELLASTRLSGQEMLMMGGGNPGMVPEAVSCFQRCMRELTTDPLLFQKYIGGYGAPGGHVEFNEAVAAMLQQLYGWNITAANIALTNGSQNAFFLLFNLFGGRSAQGCQAQGISKILLPMTPEYIGYEDVAIEEPFFISNRPLIEILDKRLFKYRVDFNSLSDDPSINAISLSRPTNPTGNVVTDSELKQLDEIALQRGIPLIIDNAYGEPFPNIIHTDVSLDWHDNIILCMSLSKIGLPSVRTGIVVANEAVVRMISKMNSVINLTPASIGPALVQPLFASGEILELSRNYIQPFYKAKSEQALAWFDEAMGSITAYAHKPEGAIFLWVWFPDLPITCEELYQRLKKRGVIVVPGNYFFPGLLDGWQHTTECIRISYAMDDEIVRRGIFIISEEVKKAYNNS